MMLFKGRFLPFTSILIGARYVIKVLKTSTIYLPTTVLSNICWWRSKNLLGWKIQHNSISSLYLDLYIINQKNKKGIIKFNTISTVLWKIWLESNNRIFKEKNNSTINLWKDICALSKFWTSRSPLFSNYSSSFITTNLNAF